MRVLFLYPYLPSPEAGHGSARVVSRLLADLKDAAQITLICAYRPGERPLVDTVRPLCHRLVAVERRFSSDMKGARRMSERTTTGARLLATGYPVPVVKLRRTALRRAVREALRQERYDLAHVESSVMAQYVELFPGAPSVLVDFEAGGPPGKEEGRWREYIRRVYRHFDRVLTLSEEDREDLLRIDPGLRIGVRPPGIRAPRHVERHPEPDRVLFFGSLDHEPNRDALAWAASEILPELRRLRPGVRLVCGGFPRDAEDAEEARGAGIETLGFVDDLAAELARAAVVLSPVRLGRGVRIKNIETLVHRVPLVTTELGARGLAGVRRHCRVAEGTAALARAVAALLADPEGAERMAELGRRAALARFTFEQQVRVTLDAWRDARSGAPGS